MVHDTFYQQNFFVHQNLSVMKFVNELGGGIILAINLPPSAILYYILNFQSPCRSAAVNFFWSKKANGFGVFGGYHQ